MTAALTLDDVVKRYGKRAALDGLSFSVARGSITGLIGPNGAGKTTCFGVVGGLLRTDRGRIDVLGMGPYQPLRQRGMLGMLPQDSELPPHARVRTQLLYLAELSGFSPQKARLEAERVIELVALGDRVDGRIGELSHGMRRRVAVAQALIGSPPLVLLDEPTSGLDPHLVKHMRDVIVAENRDRGSTFIVSSHVLADLEAIADHVVFIEKGRTMKSGALASVTGRGQSVRIRLARSVDLVALQAAVAGVALSLDGVELVVTFGANHALASVNRRVLEALFALGAEVLEVRSGESLERTYLSEREKWQA